MNKNILKIIIVAFSLAIGQAFADCHGKGKFCDCEKTKFTQTIQSLNLSSDQQAKINAIREQTIAAGQSNKDQMKAIRAQINQLVHSDNIDQAKLDSLINQKKELLGSMMKTKIIAKHQMYALLTPQQKTEFQQKMHQMESN